MIIACGRRCRRAGRAAAGPRKLPTREEMMKTGTGPEATLKNSVKIVPRSKVTALYMNAWPMNSARPSSARLRVLREGDWAISRKEIVLRCSTTIESSGSESFSSGSSRTSLSIEPTIALGLVVAAVDEQPARALGHAAAHDQDRRRRARRRCRRRGASRSWSRRAVFSRSSAATDPAPRRASRSR